MNQQSETAAAVKPAITEADVIAWIRDQHAACNLPEGTSLSVTYWPSEPYLPARTVFGHYLSVGGEYIHASGGTIAQSLQQFRAKLPPAGQALAEQLMREAEEKRAEALRILADLNGKGVTA